MSKFWSVILKIIIVISILGIIFFVGVAIFRNHNISFEAYNYISRSQEETDFDTLQTNIANNVKVAFEGANDPYANYINSAVTQLNEGIDYFTDYLAHEKELTKGEQDKLINLYDKYISGFYETEGIYEEYIDAYKSAEEKEGDYEGSDYVRTNCIMLAGHVVDSYLGCYKNGLEFFKYLTQVVNKYTLDNTGLFSYKAQSYIIKCGIVEYSLNFIKVNMTKKIALENYTANPKSNQLVNTYYLYLANSNKFSNADSVTNTAFKNFKNNLNTLNIFEWAGNYSNYIKTLDDAHKTNASNALTFFNNNFKG